MKDYVLRLTLVVPTYNRHRYALRNMRYWSGRNIAVLVMDGSPSPISLSELSGLDSNIHYHHQPISFFDRLKIATELISTEYCVLMGDDEFFIPSALEACIAELDLDSDLVSCMGQCIGFDISMGKVVGSEPYPMLNNYSILQDDPIERMLAHMNYYVPSTIYAVTKSEVWCKAMDIVAKRDFPAYAIGELQFELAVCYQGKSKVISELVWLRSAETLPIRGTDKSLMPEKTFEGWWENSANKTEHFEFLKIMSDSLAKNQAESIKVVHGVSEALNIFVAVHLSKNTLIEYIQSNLIKFVKYPIKFLISRGLKIFPFLPNPIRRPLMLDIAKNWVKKGVKVDLEELSKIELIVKESHKNH